MTRENLQFFVVDDCALFREGMVALSRQAYPNSTCLASADSSSGLALLNERRFDLLFLDVGLRSGMTGIELLAHVRRYDGPNKKTPALIASARNDERTIQSSFKAGANGYLGKDVTDRQELEAAIATVLAGKAYLPDARLQALMAKINSSSVYRTREDYREVIAALTERQRQVAVRVARFKTNPQIAKELGLAGRSSVDVHLQAIFAKFGVKNRVQFHLLVNQYVLQDDCFVCSVA